MRTWIGLAGLFVAALAGQVRAISLDDYEPPEAGSVRIVRDSFGVPHIIARDDRGLFFGSGYCQAQDQLENMAMNMLRAQGRAAEREGMGAVPIDHLVRVLGIPNRAQQQLDQLSDAERLPLDAFVAGVQAYMKEHPDQVPDWVEPIRPEDILAFSDYIDVLFSASHCQRDLAAAGIKVAGLETLPPLRSETLGSNQFAVAPKRSATGAAMLSMDPHLPHESFYRWYEMHLVGPNFNVMGACFFGSPYVSMGRTERSAWCMTVNGPDLGDVFAFDVNPDDPSQLKGLDGWETFAIGEEIHKVKTPGGLAEIKLRRQGSPVGPVIATKDGVAYAFALPLSETPARAGQILNMTRAKTVDEFRDALQPLGFVMFNIVYADADGDIFYISNARLPKRDLRIGTNEIRPGDEAWARWQGIHKLQELPQVLNPPAGYVMNTNSGPQNVTPEVAPQPKDYPAYFMSQPANSRSRRLSALLAADESLDFDEMHAYATDTYLLAADEFVPKFVALIDAQQRDFEGDSKTLKEVGQILSAWDRRTDFDSKGAALFYLLITDNEVRAAIEKGEHQAAGQAIVDRANAMRQQFGALDAPWSEFSRIRRGNVELGVAGNGIRGPLADLGMTALRPTYGNLKDGRRYCTGGSSYAMIVDFSGETRSISCLPFGVCEDPSSPHFADQMTLYSQAKYKPAWFRPDELREHTESDVVVKVRM